MDKGKIMKYLILIGSLLFLLGCGEEGSYVENSDGTYRIIDVEAVPTFITAHGLPPAPMPIAVGGR